MPLSQRYNQNRDNVTSWQKMMARNVIIKPFVSSPSDSCSMTSGKSGLWCDANLSCLRISTPQKPWSPTAELKRCWPPTMDSRSHDLPALGSTAPPYSLPSTAMDILLAWSPELNWWPTLGSPSLFPPSVYPESLVLLHSCCPDPIISAAHWAYDQCTNLVFTSLRFLLSQVNFFFFIIILRGAGVCLCVF